MYVHLYYLDTVYIPTVTPYTGRCTLPTATHNTCRNLLAPPPNGGGGGVSLDLVFNVVCVDTLQLCTPGRCAAFRGGSFERRRV